MYTAKELAKLKKLDTRIALALVCVSMAAQAQQGESCVKTETTSVDCAFSLPATSHGASVIVKSHTPGYAGWFEGTCLNTSWSAVRTQCKIKPSALRAPAQCKAGLIFTWGADVARQTTLTRIGVSARKDLEAESLRRGLKRSSYGLCYGVTKAALTGQTMKVVHRSAPALGQMDLTCNAQGVWVPTIAVKPGYTLTTRAVTDNGGATHSSQVKVPPFMGDATCDLYRAQDAQTGKPSPPASTSEVTPLQ